METTKEQFDFKRFSLISIKRLWIVVVTCLIAIVLGCGGNYLLNVVFAGTTLYRCDATYSIEFDMDYYDTSILYYNDYTWNDVIDSELIAGRAAQIADVSKELIDKASSVPTMSDIRIFHVYIDMEDGGNAVKVQKAVGQALSEFAESTQGFISITEWDCSDAVELKNNIMMIRCGVVFGILGIALGFLILLYINATDDSIYTHEDAKKYTGCASICMYGDNLSADARKSMTESLNAIIGDSKAILFAPYEECLKTILERNAMPDSFGIDEVSSSEFNELVNRLKSADKKILVVLSGNHDGKRISYEVDRLRQMDISIDGVITVGNNSSFLKGYYRGF